jgi:predicted aconitase with swiveling domain
MILKGRKIIGGRAEGEAITSTEGISFYGSVDVKSGKVVEKDHPLEGQCITGKVLVFPTGKGSTVGSYVIYEMKKRGTAPAAIINSEIETIVAVGAIISDIPCVDRIEIEKIKNGDRVKIDADNGTVEVL